MQTSHELFLPIDNWIVSHQGESKIKKELFYNEASKILTKEKRVNLIFNI